MMDFREVIYLIISIGFGLFLLMMNANANTYMPSTDLQRVYRQAQINNYLEAQNQAYINLNVNRNNRLEYENTLNNVQVEQELFLRRLNNEQ